MVVKPLYHPRTFYKSTTLKLCVRGKIRKSGDALVAKMAHSPIKTPAHPSIAQSLCWEAVANQECASQHRLHLGGIIWLSGFHQ